MGLTAEFVRCEPHDPNRCQASGIGGQCPYKAKEGTQYCPRHSAKTDTIAAQNAANMYRLEQYQNRMSELTTHNEIKNLRAEIGILRMSLEAIVKSCQGQDTMLIAYSGKISDMILKINILVKTCQGIEKALGLSLDRDKIMLIGNRIVEILGAHVSPEILDLVNNQIVESIYAVSMGEELQPVTAPKALSGPISDAPIIVTPEVESPDF